MSRGTEAPEVAVELVPASLEANLDALEAYVTGAVEELSADGLDCTDPDNYRWAKGARAQLNRMAKAVSQERNRVKRDYMRPFKAFEDRCKAIERKATDAAKRLGEPIAEADEAWRARRTAELEAFYAEGAELLAPVVPLPRLMDGERWLRRSCSLPKAQEEMAQVYVRAYGMDICMTRSFNHGGAGQRLGFLIPDFAAGIVRVERGEAKSLKVGNLTARRDFTHVKDVVRAYRLIAEKGRPGEVYNVGSGETHSAQEILDKLCAMASCPIPVEQDPAKLRPSDTPVICCDRSKLTNDTGWAPQIPLEAILRDTIAWYRSR